jgi:hypothetical protein
MNLIKTDVEGFMKDKDSGAVVNVDNRAYQAHLAKRNKIRGDAMRLNQIERDVAEIKGMLRQLLNMNSRESGEK